MILETPLQELQQYETLLGRMQRQMEAELERRTSENRIDGYYPDEGPLRRELYPKHLEFFRAGIEHRERCFLAANRVGKTEGVGGYELTCHLTGEYPTGGRVGHSIIPLSLGGRRHVADRSRHYSSQAAWPDWCLWDRADLERADRSNYWPPGHS